MRKMDTITLPVIAAETKDPAKRHRRYQRLLVALLPLYVMATVYYGWRVPCLAIFSMLVCKLLDLLCLRLRGVEHEKGDVSSFTTGLALVLLFPVTVPFWVLLLGCFGAICLAKHPFGGAGCSPFVPAAVGFCLSAVCFPGQVLTYPAPFAQIPVFEPFAGKLSYSTVHMLAQGALPDQDLWDLLLGQAAGPLGQSSMLVICGCLLFLLLCGGVDWRVTLSTLVSSAAFAFVFPRSGLSAPMAVVYELAGGTLLFAACFLAAWPGSLPVGKTARIVYGVVLGISGMLFRYFGQLDLGFVFAMVCCNALTPSFDVMTGWLIRLAKSTPKLLGHQQKYINRPIKAEPSEEVRERGQ